MMNIKVLGINGAPTNDIYAKVEQALNELKIKGKIEMVEDVDVFIAYKLANTPALVINDEVTSFDTTPDYTFIRTLLNTSFYQNQ